MLTEICAKLHNYFLVPNGIHKGEFTIEGGKITPLDFYKRGNILGSWGASLTMAFIGMPRPTWI